MKKIKIVIDQNLLEEYYKYYFDKYPRRKTKPILKTIPPSLNYFTSITRMAQSSLKKRYKEFSIWIANHYDVADLNLNKAEISYKFFFKNNQRRDVDNLMLTPKLINDGFVEAKFLMDDNGQCLRLLFEPFEYDKINPRVEMIIKNMQTTKEN